jgi:hypothetical protein
MKACVYNRFRLRLTVILFEVNAESALNFLLLANKCNFQRHQSDLTEQTFSVSFQLYFT